MEFVIIGAATFLTAILTFFSGFGLGTILLPIFALFFPIEIAIALTGVVHLANNTFKFIVVRKHVNWNVFLHFGLPAILASFIGAWLLLRVADLPELMTYKLGERSMEISPINLSVAIILLVFAFQELLPSTRRQVVKKKRLILGGLISGVLGGFAGIQGAVRGTFLIRTGMGKEAYIATGALIAMVVDITRLSVYASVLRDNEAKEQHLLVLVGIVAALCGVLLGKRLLKKVTFRLVQVLVALMLILVALLLGTGIL